MKIRKYMAMAAVCLSMSIQPALAQGITVEELDDILNAAMENLGSLSMPGSLPGGNPAAAGCMGVVDNPPNAPSCACTAEPGGTCVCGGSSYQRECKCTDRNGTMYCYYCRSQGGGNTTYRCHCGPEAPTRPGSQSCPDEKKMQIGLLPRPIY